MTTLNKITNKKSYIVPQIDCVKLDNEISLALESAPPIGPDEVNNRLHNSTLQDPFKTLNA